MLSGAALKFEVFGDPAVLLAGVVYIVARSLGKYLGAGLSSSMVHSPEPVRKYLGVTLLPQAGVALGMCATACRVLGGADGTLVRNIVLFSVLVYELVGPSLTKWALTRAGDIRSMPDEVGRFPPDKGSAGGCQTGSRGLPEITCPGSKILF